MRHISKPEIDMELLDRESMMELTQATICKCDVTCNKFIDLDEYGYFCESAAREIALSIISLLDGINRVDTTNRTKERTHWTTKEERFISDWYAKNKGANYGDIRLIANFLNKPYERTAYKIKAMRKRGMIE